MADNTDVTLEDGSQPSVENDGQTDNSGLIKMMLNNQEVEVPASAASVLNQMEHNLKSGYDKKLTEERKQVENERRQVQDQLAGDLEWLNTHDDWTGYEPTVQGGRGYVGAGTPKAQTSSGDSSVTNPQTFSDTAKIPALEKRIRELESRQQNDATNTDEREKARVVSTRNALLKKYPYAIEEAVTAELQNYLNSTGYHASDGVIENTVKEMHNKVQEKARRVNPGQTTQPTGASVGKTTTATPVVGGAIPQSTKEPTLGLDDPKLIERVTEKLPDLTL